MLQVQYTEFSAKWLHDDYIINLLDYYYWWIYWINV